MRLSQFPRDTQQFIVQFVAAGYPEEQLDFVPDSDPNAPGVRGGGIADRLSLPDWQILNHEALEMPYSPISTANAAGFGLRFEARRHMDYYLWQVVLPLAVVVMMSWAPFWLSRREVGVRIGVATSSVLTMIAHKFVLASLLPKLPYMTLMDYLAVGSTLLVLLALLMVTFVAFVTNKGQQHLARHFDLVARVLFPVAFLSLLAWFLFS